MSRSGSSFPSGRVSDIPRFLLDTSAAIILRDTSSADQRLRDLASLPALSIVSVVELEGGVVKEPSLNALRRRLLDRMVQQFPLLDFDADCACAYRRIVEAAGFSRPRIVDRMIAATALVHRLALITSNPRDFRDVPDLMLEEWPPEPSP